MKTITVKERISKVLLENTNGFLSIEEIARIGYGEAYMRDTQKQLNGLIKRNISHAIALLSDKGLVVLKDLEETKNGSKLRYKTVNGYKIADKEDVEQITANLLSRKERFEIAKQTRIDFGRNMVEAKLIEDNNNLLIENK